MEKHIFEQAELGKAPFRLVRFEMREQDPHPTAPRIGTSCDYCGTYITKVFHCESSDGKKFVIGSSCVEKLGDKGLIEAVKNELRQKQYEQRQAKKLAQWEAGKEKREKEAAERQAKYEQERAERLSENEQQWFYESQALAEALRMKDYSKIRSEFKLKFLHGLVEQFDEQGFISQKQKKMVYGTGEWNGSFFDRGMLNDNDYLNEMIALYVVGDENCKRMAKEHALALGEDVFIKFEEAVK